MKRTILLTIMAMTLVLGASRANMPAGTNKAEEHHGLAKWSQAGGEMIAGKDLVEQQKPVQLNVPGYADREKPLLLIAPHCVNCTNPDSSVWEKFQSILSSVFYWI